MTDKSRKIGFFPAGADPVTHMASIPYARKLGLVWENGSPDEATVLLPFSESVCNRRRTAVDPLAIIGLIDHACSAAVYVALDRQVLIATTDLRIEFTQIPDDHDDIRCIARSCHIQDGFAVIRATAISTASQRPVAYASSTYAIGSHPGMRGKEAVADSLHDRRVTDEQTVSDAGFSGIFELGEQERGYSMGFQPHLIGATSLPAIHGGVTAAALTAAAARSMEKLAEPAECWIPLSTTIHYLRAVKAETVELDVAVRKRGYRNCLFSVSANQGGREAAHAEVLFASTSTNHPNTWS